MNVYNNRAWAEIDLDAICHNVYEIRKHVGKKRIMGVVKADGYGHGAIDVSKELIDCGVDYLAVSMIDEAMQLRMAGIKVPILVFGHTHTCAMHLLVEHDITQTVYDFQSARELDSIAKQKGKRAKVHVKVDTGMSRLGYLAESDVCSEISKLFKLDNIYLEGIYSHFSIADEQNDVQTNIQLDSFLEVVSKLEDDDMVFPIRHIANSAGTMFYEESYLDMVRPGLILYGLYPNNLLEYEGWNLKPAMALKANVMLGKEINKGRTISYGRTYLASENMKVATIPIGYADGFLRALQEDSYVLIRGERARVVGRICMDQCVVDVNHLEDIVSIGEEVVIIGKQGDKIIRVEDIAKCLNTINYEVICVIGKRIPRLYVKEGKVVSHMNYLVKRN